MKTRSFFISALVIAQMVGILSRSGTMPGSGEKDNSDPPLGGLCTSFCLDGADHCVFGTNLDHDEVKTSQVFVNKRGVLKTGWESGTTGKYARWISKYGSVTINQAGYQLAWAGMNEAGLMISTMSLMGTMQPGPDERPPLPSPLWVQYQLDNSSTIQEVIASDSLIRVTQAGEHYLVCDRTGACAVIEFLDGRMIVHSGTSLPVKALANSTYQDSLIALRDADYWKLEVFRLKPSGPAEDAGILVGDRILMVDGIDMTGENAINNLYSILAEYEPGDDLSFTVLHAGDAAPDTVMLTLGPLPEDLSKYILPPGAPAQVLSLGLAASFTGDYLTRFAQAAEWVEAFKPSNSGNAVAYAFDALKAVSRDDTVFSVVFDPIKLRMYFRSYINTKIRYLDFKELDFSCGVPVMMLDDIHAAGYGDILSSLVEYSHSVTLDYMLSVLPTWTDTPSIAIHTILTGFENNACMEDNNLAISNPDAYLRDHPSLLPPLVIWIELIVIDHLWWLWLVLVVVSLAFMIRGLVQSRISKRRFWFAWILITIVAGPFGCLALWLSQRRRYRRAINP